MTRAGKAAGFAGRAFAALAITGAAVATFSDSAERLGSEQLIRGLSESGDALSAINAELRRTQAGDIGMFNSGIHDLGDALRYTFDPSVGSKADNVLGSIFSAFGADNVSDISQARQRLQELDATMAQLVGGGKAQQAADMMAAIATEAKNQGISVGDLAAKFPAYQEALAAAANQAKDVGDKSKRGGAEVDSFGGSIDEAGKNAADAAKSLDDLSQSFSDLGSQLLGQRGSARDFQAAIDDATQSVQDNGRSHSARIKIA
jgi:hypothetical protein